MNTYCKWLESCKQVNLPAITTDTAARLMAVLYEYGNNEGFTLSQKFLAEKDYIQDRFGLREMCTLLHDGCIVGVSNIQNTLKDLTGKRTLDQQPTKTATMKSWRILTSQNSDS